MEHKKGPLLMSIRDMQITLSPDGDDVFRRALISVKALFMPENIMTDLKLDISDVVRSRSGSGVKDIMELAISIRDEISELESVLSCCVMVTDPDAGDDVDAVSFSTIPDPKHAVIYGIFS